MNYSKKLFLIFFCLALVFQAHSQTRTLIKADKAFAVEEYNEAAELYKKAYSKTKNKALKAEITFKQAECYRNQMKYKRAESYYKRAIKVKYPDVIVHLRYADMLKMNGKYTEALKQYEKYVKLNPTDIKGEKGVKSCQMSVNWIADPTTYKIALMPIVNSKYLDFSPAFGNKDYTEIYFSSNRPNSTTIH